MIADILNNKKLNAVVAELLIRGGKVEKFPCFSQSHFAVPQNIILNFTHYFIIKIPSKWELQQWELFLSIKHLKNK